jgi:hypothetical protein
VARGPQVAALALAALAAVLVGCGGGSKTAQPLPRAPTLTVPGEKTTPAVPKRAKTTTDTTTSAATSTAPTPTASAPPNPSTPAGGAAPPQTGGASPNTQQNDQSPPAGSPAQKFEQFCKDNPGAC